MLQLTSVPPQQLVMTNRSFQAPVTLMAVLPPESPEIHVCPPPVELPPCTANSLAFASDITTVKRTANNAKNLFICRSPFRLLQHRIHQSFHERSWITLVCCLSGQPYSVFKVRFSGRKTKTGKFFLRFNLECGFDEVSEVGMRLIQMNLC